MDKTIICVRGMCLLNQDILIITIPPPGPIFICPTQAKGEINSSIIYKLI